jgi:hypothetical protein
VRFRYAELGRSVGKPVKVEKAGDVILADLDEEIISVKGGLPYVSEVCLTLGGMGERGPGIIVFDVGCRK